MKIIPYLLIVFLFLVGSCSDNNSVSADAMRHSQPSEKLIKIGHETDLVFPSHSRVVYFFEPDRVVDPVWVAKIIIPPRSYEHFKDVLLSKPINNTVYHGALAETTSWWNPIKVILTKQYLANSQTFVNVVISKENESIAIYIECAVF